MLSGASFPAGLLNAEERGFVEVLLKQALEQLNAALGDGDRNRARLLLRLFAALVPSNALHASSVLKALTTVVEAAIEIADKGQFENPKAPMQMEIDILMLWKVSCCEKSNASSQGVCRLKERWH